MSDGATMTSGQTPNFMRTVRVFALVGPVVGGVVPYLATLVVLVIPVMIKVHGIGNVPAVLFAASTVFAIGLLYACILAIVPSILSGFAIAAWENSKGRSSIWFAALVGLIAGLVWVAAYLLLGLSPDEAREFYSPETFFIVIGSVIASMFCWWLVWRRERAA